MVLPNLVMLRDDMPTNPPPPMTKDTVSPPMANIPPCDPDQPNGKIYFNEAKITSIIENGAARHMMEIRFELSFQRDLEIKVAKGTTHKEAIYAYVDEQLREPVAIWLKKNHLQYRDAKVIQVSFDTKLIYVDLGAPSSKLEEFKQIAKAMGIDMEELIKEAITDNKKGDDDDNEFVDDITPIDPHEERKLEPHDDGWGFLKQVKQKAQVTPEKKGWRQQMKKKLWDNRLKGTVKVK
jgi:hypothetical protein